MQVKCEKGQQKSSSEVLSRYFSSPSKILKTLVALLNDGRNLFMSFKDLIFSGDSLKVLGVLFG